MTHNNDELLTFLRELRRMDTAVMPLIAWRMKKGASLEELREHIDNARAATADMVTDLVAVYCAVVMVGTVGIRPTRRTMHGFTVSTCDGQPVDVDDVPPAAVARARMVVAIANSEPLAARDVFIAYRRTHDHAAVTAFIAGFVDMVSQEATRRGMTMAG